MQRPTHLDGPDPIHSPEQLDRTAEAGYEAAAEALGRPERLVDQTATPPLSLVPLAPGEIAAASTSGYHVRATFTIGAGAEQYGHLYLVDVLTAAVVCGEVWDALASACLAGLCLRCSSVQEAERLIREHVEDVVVANAGAYAWTHAPVIDEPCQLCQEIERLKE